MQHHFDDLTQLAAVSGTDSKLLHLLTCPDCRRWAVKGLLEQCAGTGEDDTEDYSPVFARLAQADPARLEKARARRAEAERLFTELMDTPGEERFGALRTSRFRDSGFLDVLLEQCHARQIEDPGQAAEIAVLAAELAADLTDEEGEEVTEPLRRALCLRVNALRLAGQSQETEEMLGRVAVLLETRDDRAFYCRLLAILRWEQGRAAEATALLEHAARLYQNGTPGEHGVCLALMGLLAAEEEKTADALPLLYRGWALMDRDLRPLIALRVALSLAYCFTQAEQEDQARCFLREAWRLTPEVHDPREAIRALWQEARALGALGQRGEARDLLESVFHALAAEGSFAESVLASLDLALFSESAELEPIVSLLRSVEAEPQYASALALGLNAIKALEACSAERGRMTLEESARVTSSTLRRAFRNSGLPMKPLPFA